MIVVYRQLKSEKDNILKSFIQGSLFDLNGLQQLGEFC